MFSSEAWLSNSSDFYNGVATQSLRFDDGSSAYLSRTPSSAGNRKTWTWSGWVKRSLLGSQQKIMSSASASLNYTTFEFTSSDTLQLFSYFSSATQAHLQTSAVFRDISAWYHIVVYFDASNTTAKLYVNGIEQSLQTNTQPSNQDYFINSTNEHRIGRAEISGTNYFDGYLAEVNFIDGQALDPTSFGEFKNGVWIAKKYTGSYGTNGFRLQFNQTGTGTASSSTIGADTSGNANHFSSSGIVASDCAMLDSPELNFCTLSALHLPSNTNNELIKGALVADATSSSWGQAPASWAFQAGEKWYWEVSADNTAYYVGVASPNVVRQSANALIGWDNPLREAWVYNSGGQIRYNGANQTTTTAITANDILAFAVDVDGGTLRFYINNVLKYTASHDFTGWFPDCATINSVYLRHNFGQDGTFAGLHTAQGNTDENGYGDFYYTPPSGYLAMCSANLNTAEAVDPAEGNSPTDYFNTVTYTGTGSSPQSVTGVGFQPDWIWIKNRSSAYSHVQQDVIRGFGELKKLSSNSANAEGTSGVNGDNYGHVSSSDTDGFTVTHTINASDDGGTIRKGTHYLNDTYVGWNWKAGGIGVVNSNGSINSEVSVNDDAGFSVVTYTGNGTAGATIGHGLASTPEFIIFKVRTASGYWHVYHEYIGATKAIYLNAGNSGTTDANFLNNTAPTSSVITLGSSSGANGSSENYVAYAFHSVEGYSKFGGYQGNSNSDGVYLHLGFRPAWFMVKVATGFTNNWTIYDSATTTYNADDTYLLANGSGAETTANAIDFLSNGVKIRNSSQAENNSGGTYIYMAFAENPFKYANAR